MIIRKRRLSTSEDELDRQDKTAQAQGPGPPHDMADYYGQNPTTSLASQTSWHSEVDQSGLSGTGALSALCLCSVSGSGGGCKFLLHEWEAWELFSYNSLFCFCALHVL